MESDIVSNCEVAMFDEDADDNGKVSAPDKIISKINAGPHVLFDHSDYKDLSHFLAPLQETVNLQSIAFLHLYDLGADNIKNLAGALQENRSLKSLNIALEGLPDLTPLWDGLAQNGRFTEIEINHFDNRDVDGIVAILKGNKNLISLKLVFNVISSDAFGKIADAVSQHPSIKKLSLLGNNQCDEDSAKHLGNMCRLTKSLQTLELLSMGLTQTTLAPIIHGLKQNATIAAVNFGYNDALSTESGELIADLIKTNKCIQAISCYECSLGDGGLKAIADALKSNETRLTELNLRSNKITSESAELVASALENNKELLSIDLSCNQIGERGARLIAEALKKNSMLKEVNLSQNEMTHDGVMAFAAMLQSNSTLKWICLLQNQYVGNDSDFISLIENNISIEKLFVNGHDSEVKGYLNRNKAIEENKCNEMIADDLRQVSNIDKSQIKVLELGISSLQKTKKLLDAVKYPQTHPNYESIDAALKELDAALKELDAALQAFKKPVVRFLPKEKTPADLHRDLRAKMICNP